MAFSHPKCSRTGQYLPASACNHDGRSACPSCGGEIQALVFPALFRAAETSAAGEALTQELESGCFYHAAKKAVRVCDGCGVFLCALCDVKISDRHLCPACIEKGRAKGKLKELENRRLLYDDMALSISFLSLLIFCLAIFIAPVAIFLAVRHWNTPCSVIPRTRARKVIAIVLSLAALAGWIVWVVYLVRTTNF